MHTTPVSLLLRLHEPGNQDAWRRFVTLYLPLLHVWANKINCPRAEADDLVQEIFAVLIRKLPTFQYDKDRSFRAYLQQITRNKWYEKLRKDRLPVHALGDGDVADPGSDDPAEEFWNKEFNKLLIDRALQIMQRDFPEKTWQACWDLVYKGKTAAEVAKEQGMTVGAVHAARFRVLSRLREELRGLMD